MTAVSERKRGRTVTRLQQGYASGALSTQTLEQRLERALRANTPRALRQVTIGLSPRSLLDRARARFARKPASSPSSGLLVGLADERPKVLGRSRSCDVVLTNDSVSRRHAILVRDGDRYVLTDLGSTNATYLNGRRVIQAQVVPGDHVQLGEVRLIL